MMSFNLLSGVQLSNLAACLPACMPACLSIYLPSCLPHTTLCYIADHFLYPSYMPCHHVLCCQGLAPADGGKEEQQQEEMGDQVCAEPVDARN